MRVVVLVVVLASVIAGCGSGKTVVGKWDSKLKARTGEVTFNEDGSVKYALLVPEDLFPGGLTITGVGTYKLDGNTLTIKLDKADVENFPKELESAKEKVVAGFAKGMDVGKEIKSSVEFKDADSFVATQPDGEKRTFTRKK